MSCSGGADRCCVVLWGCVVWWRCEDVLYGGGAARRYMVEVRGCVVWWRAIYLQWRDAGLEKPNKRAKDKYIRIKSASVYYVYAYILKH